MATTTTTTKHDPALVSRYRDAAARIKNLQPGTPEYEKNAGILKQIGGQYGFNWQNDLGLTSGKTTSAPMSGPPQISTDYKDPKQAFQDEVKVADYSAGRQIGYNNPNIEGPLGGQTVTQNPDGSVSVKQSLSSDQQSILDKDSKLSQMGRDLAQERLNSGGFGQGFTPNIGSRSFDASSGPNTFSSNLGPRRSDGTGLGDTFNPSLTARTGSGDLVADRQRIEDSIFKNLTRDLSTKKADEKNQLEQTLYGRGIPLDPRNPIYSKAMEDLNKRYDQQEENARLNATQIGGDEYSRSFGIGETARANDYTIQSGTRGINFNEGQTAYQNQEQQRSTDFGQNLATHQQQMGDVNQRFGMQETQRTNDFGQQLAGRQQNFAETSGLAGFGTGVTLPNLPGYQAPTYQLPNPTDIWGTMKGVNQNQQSIDLQKKQLASQEALSRLNSGGGGSQSSAQQAPNPFNGL